MTTLTASEARSSLYRLIDKASTNHQPVLITGKRHNAVLVSAHPSKQPYISCPFPG